MIKDITTCRQNRKKSRTGKQLV